MTPARTAPLHSILLLQEPLFEADIWAPLAQALAPAIQIRFASPPPTTAMFSGPAWARHVEKFLTAEAPGTSVSLVVADSASAEAGIAITARGFAQSVLLLNPPISAVLTPLDERAKEAIAQTLDQPDMMEQLLPIVSAITPEQHEQLQRTGQLPLDTITELVDAILVAHHGRDPELLGLMRHSAIRRLNAVFPLDWDTFAEEEDPTRTVHLRALGPHAALALPRGSAFDLTGLRDQIPHAAPEAKLYALPDHAQAAGWWEQPETYKVLIGTVLDELGSP